MMKFLIIFSLVIATSFGLKWNDFRGGDLALPSKLTDAEKEKWTVAEKDETLGITWMVKDKDFTLSVGFDKKGTCAGVRFYIIESEIDAAFSKLYSSKNSFEACVIDGKKALRSTVLFADNNILKSGGRAISEEVALGCYISGEMLARDGCNQIKKKKSFYEQGCKSGHGLILSSYQSKSECSTLSPFYAIYDPKERGNLLGFGWLSFSKTAKTTSFSKQLTAKTLQNLFGTASSCLTPCQGLTTVDVWLSHAESKKSSCPNGSWTKDHCKKKFRIFHRKDKNEDSDSSISSDSSSSDSSSHSGEKHSILSKIIDTIHLF